MEEAFTMNTLSVLIVDDDKELCNELKYDIEKYSQFDLLEPVHCGGEAIEAIKIFRPDMIILDLFLPIYDGLYIVDFIAGKIPNYRPTIYILSSIATETTLNILDSYETVKYYSIKPVYSSDVVRNLCRLAAEKKGSISNASYAQSISDFDNFTTGNFNLDGDVDCIVPERLGNLSLLVESYLKKLGFEPFEIATKCVRLAIEMRIKADINSRFNVGEFYKQFRSRFVPTLSSATIDRKVRDSLAKIEQLRTPYFTECFPYGLGSYGGSSFTRKSAIILKQWIVQNSLSNHLESENDKASLRENSTISGK